MIRMLQINTNGAWKNVLPLSDGGAKTLEGTQRAVELLASCSDSVVSFRVIGRRTAEEDKVIVSWDRQRGWRRGRSK